MRKKAKKIQDEKKSEATHPKRKTTKKKINLQDKKALGLDPYLKCYICKIEFDTPKAYLIHVHSKHEGRNHDLSICNDCGKPFKTPGQLKVHLASKCGKIRSFICDICSAPYMTAAALYEHKKRHTKPNEHMCKFCAKTFFTASRLKVHERKHTKEKVFQCDVCNKGFAHWQSLVTHSTLHTGIKPFRCDNCERTFSCIGNLLKHRRTHADTCGLIALTNHRVDNLNTKWKVHANTPASTKLKAKQREELLKSFLAEDGLTAIEEAKVKSETEYGINRELEPNENKNSANIDDFKETKIEDKEDELVTPKNKPEELWKNILDDSVEETKVHSEIEIKVEDLNTTEEIPEVKIENFKTEAWTENITNDFDFDPSIQEDSNDGQFDDSVSIKPDIEDSKEITEIENNISIKKERFQCDKCNRSFTKKGWLQKHHKKSHESKAEAGAPKRKPKNMNLKSEPPYKCVCCTQVFKTKSDRLLHNKESHRDLLGCDECDKMFTSVQNCKRHRSHSHLGIPQNSFVCESCGLSLSTKTNMDIHNKSQCGKERHYKCTSCSKKFFSKYHLKNHLETHAAEKNHLCKFCAKSFLRKGQLQIHERIHTGIKPYKCKSCPKAFAWRESLITHTSLHTGIKTHVCIGCGARFSCIGNLIKHRKRYTECGDVPSGENQEKESGKN